MKAKAKLELLVELDVPAKDDSDSLAAAKAELLTLMGKLKKVATKVRCASLTLQADEDSLSDLVVE